MKFKGKAFVFGNDIDTDAIIPARYLNVIEAEELARHCMEDADATFVDRVRPGDVIVGGKNFGCGSSREHAPLAIKAAGVGCVVAASFARIFYRNSFNTGLILVECPEAAGNFSDGEDIEVDLDTGLIKNASRGIEFTFQPIPEFMLELVAAGGLIKYILAKQSRV